MELGVGLGWPRAVFWPVFQKPLQSFSSGDGDCRTVRTGRQAQTDDTQVTL